MKKLYNKPEFLVNKVFADVLLTSGFREHDVNMNDLINGESNPFIM